MRLEVSGMGSHKDAVATQAKAQNIDCAGSPDSDPEMGIRHPVVRRKAFSRDSGVLLQCCTLFMLLAAAVLLTIDARRLTWVLQHLPGKFSRPQTSTGQDQALQGDVDDLLTKALDFLEMDYLEDWDRNSVKEDRGMRIPRILHHVFLDGEVEYSRLTEEAKAKGSGMKREWRDSCVSLHSNWTYMFWDKAAALELLKSRYPWFIPTFLSYTKVVSQGDALRPFLMHAFGGVYMDLDVSCYRSTEPFLAGYDLVFQSEWVEQNDVGNAVVASVPGHPFWNAVIQKMIVEAKRANKKELGMAAILTTTGPNIYKQVFVPWIEPEQAEPPYSGDYTVRGTHLKYYTRGHWFVPCKWDDKECHERVNSAAAAGKADPNLAGHHQFTGTWVETLKEDTEEGSDESDEMDEMDEPENEAESEADAESEAETGWETDAGDEGEYRAEAELAADADMEAELELETQVDAEAEAEGKKLGEAGER